MRKNLFCIPILVVLLVGLTVTKVNATSSTPVVFVDPPIRFGEVGATVTINVTVTNVTELYAWSFRMLFNSSILNATKAELGTWLHDASGWPVLSMPMVIRNDLGYVFLGQMLDMTKDPTNGANGTGNLATITFKVVGTGVTTLDLDLTKLDTVISGQKVKIEHTAEDGFFTTYDHDAAVVNVVPSVSEAFPTWTISVNVTVKNTGFNTESFDVTAYYDSNVIGTLSVTNLAPVDEEILTFSWGLSGVASSVNPYPLSAKAFLSGDMNAANDELPDGTVKVRLTGDVSGDNKVTGLDQIIVGIHLFERLGDATWDPYADVSGDNKVTGLDQIIVGIHLFEKL